ncbi:hypothetical protein AB0G06_35735 [Nonomuraea dietziae]|uniref:hypothetical protein n=1 Tax=Nonomuraea dietziae TaxID=65515 RepID=UPI0033FB0CF4
MGRHLVAAERALVEDDTDRAHEHTKVARRFAARIGVVREAAGIVAYRAGNFSEALSDLRAARRMTGSDAYLPIMADCERGMGRPERALDLVRSPEAERLDRAGRIELAIVESGARRDLGQNDAAVITLQRLPELRDTNARPWSARLAFAYADALADAGHQDAATDWFARAMAFDEDGETDAAERYAELTGAVIEDIEEDFEDADEDVEGADEDLEDLEDADADVEGADEGARGMQAGDEEFGDVLDDEGDVQDGAAEARQPSDVLDDDDDEDEEPSAGDAPSVEVSGSEVAASSVADVDDEEELAEADSDEEPVDEASDDVDDVDESDESDDDVEGVDDDSDDDFDDLEEDLDGELADSTKGSTTSTEPKAAKAPGASGESEPAKTGIGPAFIEPNFGDILDDPEDSEDKK